MGKKLRGGAVRSGGCVEGARSNYLGGAEGPRNSSLFLVSPCLRGLPGAKLEPALAACLNCL